MNWTTEQLKYIIHFLKEFEKESEQGGEFNLLDTERVVEADRDVLEQHNEHFFLQQGLP